MLDPHGKYPVESAFSFLVWLTSRVRVSLLFWFRVDGRCQRGWGRGLAKTQLSSNSEAKPEDELGNALLKGSALVIKSQANRLCVSTEYKRP